MNNKFLTKEETNLIYRVFGVLANCYYGENQFANKKTLQKANIDDSKMEECLKTLSRIRYVGIQCNEENDDQM